MPPAAMGRATALAVVLVLVSGGSGSLVGLGQAGTGGGASYLPLDKALEWLDEDVRDDLLQSMGGSHARQLQQAGGSSGASGTGSGGGGNASARGASSSQEALAEWKAAERRCRGTAGSWCGVYDRRPPLRLRPAPRGNRSCPNDCSGVGNCNYDTGTCDCPAGSQGADCGSLLLRPCTLNFRASGDTPLGHIDDEGRDLNLLDPGYTESRCTGICDPITARCYCDGKHRRVNPPKGSPPGTPAPVRGRPLANHICQVSDDGKGHKLEWGQVPWQQIYGPDGWCNSDKPVVKCACLFDGFAGELCDEVTETVCPNQCSGHGECDSGFCKCHTGWYGTDCARKAAGLPLEQGLHESGARPWLKDTVRVPPEAAAASSAGAAAGGEAAQSRRHPLIYVYDLPPAYNARMLQYRNDRGVCAWRYYNSRNTTEIFDWTYGLEVLLHEMLLQSDHRTFNPESADFFYVPVYTSCFIFPIHCYADGPWWHAPSGPRVMHVANMMVEVRDWIRTHFPYWDRRGGRDHIWLMTHDEGACYAPTEIYNSSIMLSHWGRTDLLHASNTAFTPDNYSQEYVHPMQPGGWLHLIRGHPCYTPGKDLVIPALKMPSHFRSSPLLLHPPRERDVLLFLRGDVGKHRLHHYSRGIRQRLYKLAKENDWKAKYNVLIGDGSDVPGQYSEQLASAKFCVVAPGDGWSARLEDSVLHGCVPVIIMDGVRGVWEDQVELGQASIRVREAELEGLPALLAAVPERQLERMQQRLRTVWHRYAYASHPLLAAQLGEVMRDNVAHWRQQLLAGIAAGQLGPGAAERAAARMGERAAFPARDDAFNTILQWLSARIADTR